MVRFAPSALLIAGVLMRPTAAHAAGGHFDVDDAVMLEPAHCQYEAWLARAPSGPSAATLLHFGSGCRVGQVELALNIDRLSIDAERRTLAGPQVKWVTEVSAGFAAGWVWSATFDLRSGGRPAHALYAPLTWAANDALAFNVNVGADWNAAGVRTRRLGASGEWGVRDGLLLIAERAQLGGGWISRLGARFTLTDSISIDVSAARVEGGSGRVYVVGLNHDLAR